MSSPRIKDLNQLSPILNLEQCILRNTFRQVLQNGMKELGLGECHLLNFEVLLRGFALDEVGGKSVGAADETKDGGFGCYFLTEDAEGFGGEGDRFGWINEVHLLSSENDVLGA